MKSLVVGGRGLMGQWFCSFFDSTGREVVTLDPRGPTKGHRWARDTEHALQGLGEHDVVLVCTPMETSAEALAALRRAGTPALVADISSIKAPVQAELRKMARGGMKVASLHPMWGPDAVLLSDKNLLVLDCGDPQAVKEARGLFRGTAVQVHEMPLAAHDHLMGWALGLPHLLNLSFGLALARSGLRPEALEQLGGPTMKAQLKVARGVARENKELYHGIQAFNPETPEVHRAAREALQEFQRALRDKRRFKALMAACEDYFNASAPRPRARSRRKVAK